MIRPDRIHLHARKLYHNLSLPSLPAANVTAIGIELLSRLKLSGLLTVYFMPVFLYSKSEFSGMLEEANASMSTGCQLGIGDTTSYSIRTDRGGVYGTHRNPVKDALQTG